MNSQAGEYSVTAGRKAVHPQSKFLSLLRLFGAIIGIFSVSQVSANLIPLEANRVDCTTFSPTCIVEDFQGDREQTSEALGSNESHAFDIRFNDTFTDSGENMEYIELNEFGFIQLLSQLHIFPELGVQNSYGVFQIFGALTGEDGAFLRTASSFFNLTELDSNRLVVDLDFFVETSLIFHGIYLEISPPINDQTGAINGVEISPDTIQLNASGPNGPLEMRVGDSGATTVPEPGTLALFVVGLFGLGLSRHRMKTCANQQHLKGPLS